MDNIAHGLGLLYSRRCYIQCEVLTIFEYGRSPSDEEYLSLGDKIDELKSIEYSIKQFVDCK